MREPWLVAAWPGIGSVALVAATYLVQQLRPRKVHELNPTEFFEVQSVEVHDGFATASPLPRDVLRVEAPGRRPRPVDPFGRGTARVARLCDVSQGGGV